MYLYVIKCNKRKNMSETWKNQEDGKFFEDSNFESAIVLTAIQICLVFQF